MLDRGESESNMYVLIIAWSIGSARIYNYWFGFAPFKLKLYNFVQIWLKFEYQYSYMIQLDWNEYQITYICIFVFVFVDDN